MDYEQFLKQVAEDLKYSIPNATIEISDTDDTKARVLQFSKRAFLFCFIKCNQIKNDRLADYFCTKWTRLSYLPH